jgi:hypothetical protein
MTGLLARSVQVPPVAASFALGVHNGRTIRRMGK